MRWEQFNKAPEFLNRDKNSIYAMRTRYAVIYGAGSRVGKEFAKFLAEKDYGLILIDFSIDRIQQTHLYL
jgi:NADP-dependent 3-hydroxy acid dehydrogenase YdfG